MSKSMYSPLQGSQPQSRIWKGGVFLISLLSVAGLAYFGSMSLHGDNISLRRTIHPQMAIPVAVGAAAKIIAKSAKHIAMATVKDEFNKLRGGNMGGSSGGTWTACVDSSGRGVRIGNLVKCSLGSVFGNRGMVGKIKDDIHWRKHRRDNGIDGGVCVTKQVANLGRCKHGFTKMWHSRRNAAGCSRWKKYMCNHG